MLDDTYYVVQFDDGNYFHTSSFRHDDRLTDQIEKAKLYNFDWAILKDIYLQQFLYGTDLTYKVVKVKVKTLFEVLGD